VNYFFDDFMSFLYVVPLRNFESNAKEIRVSSSLRIRSIKRAELAPFSRHEFSSKVQVRAPSFALEMTHRAKKYFGTSHENEEGPAPGDEIEPVFSAMRLFKQGTFAHDLMTVIPSIDISQNASLDGSGTSKLVGPRYEILRPQRLRSQTVLPVLFIVPKRRASKRGQDRA
jgi:hypothetical protein